MSRLNLFKAPFVRNARSRFVIPYGYPNERKANGQPEYDIPSPTIVVLATPLLVRRRMVARFIDLTAAIIVVHDGTHGRRLWGHSHLVAQLV